MTNFLRISFFLFTLQTTAQQRVSLQQCIDYANQKSYVIKVQEFRAKQSENTLDQSRKNVFPTVSGSISQGLNSGRSIDPFSNDFIQSTNSSNNFSLGANVSLFNGFATKYQIQQNEYNAQAELVEITRLKRELKTKITLAYMQVLMSQELSKTAQEQVQNLQQALGRVQELVQEGNMPRTNLIDLDAQLASAEFDALNAKNNIDGAKLALAQLMSFPNSNFELQPIRLEEQTPLHENYVKNLWAGIGMQPLVKIAEMRVESSRLGIQLAKSERYPNVSLGLGLGSAYSSAAKKQLDYFQQLNFNFNQYATVRVSVPIFGAGQIQGKIRNAQLNEKIAEVNLLQNKLQLKQEIEQVFLLAKTAQEKLKSATRQLVAQQTAYASAQDRYLEGLLHTVELQAFRLNLEKALSNHIQSKYEFHFRKMVLDFYAR